MPRYQPFHHLASLFTPIGDPQDGFFYPTLTLVVDSYYMSRSMGFPTMLYVQPAKP